MTWSIDAEERDFFNLYESLHSLIPMIPEGKYENFYEAAQRMVNMGYEDTCVSDVLKIATAFAPNGDRFMELIFKDLKEKLKTIKVLWLFNELPSVKDKLWDIHSNQSFYLRDLRVIRYKRLQLLVCPDWEKTGGSLIDILLYKDKARYDKLIAQNKRVSLHVQVVDEDASCDDDEVVQL